MSEFEYIDWLRTHTPPPTGDVLLGPGDDTAAVRLPGVTLITTDMLMEGSCFLLAEAGARRVGRKSMAVNLSDIAAMAGIPTVAVVSLGLPHHAGREVAEELYLGLRERADEFGVQIVGGDTNSWPGGLVVNVTLLGMATGRGPVTRSGAKPGDWIMLTGAVGGSIRSHHLDFTPRVREAQALHALVNLHAMLDISDGLAADLGHICTESGCGAVLVADSIPLTADAHTMHDARTPLEHGLFDGEDFELLFTVSPTDGQMLTSTQPVPGVTLTKIGECTGAVGMCIEQAGVKRELPATGWVHHFG